MFFASPILTMMYHAVHTCVLDAPDSTILI